MYGFFLSVSFRVFEWRVREGVRGGKGYAESGIVVFLREDFFARNFFAQGVKILPVSQAVGGFFRRFKTQVSRLNFARAKLLAARAVYI